jgi:hypothetical protein
MAFFREADIETVSMNAFPKNSSQTKLAADGFWLPGALWHGHLTQTKTACNFIGIASQVHDAMNQDAVARNLIENSEVPVGHQKSSESAPPWRADQRIRHQAATRLHERPVKIMPHAWTSVLKTIEKLDQVRVCAEQRSDLVHFREASMRQRASSSVMADTGWASKYSFRR